MVEEEGGWGWMSGSPLRGLEEGQLGLGDINRLSQT